MKHPITPPEELRRQWQSECPFFVISVQREDWMIDRAAQWGADEQLKLDAEQIAQAYQAGSDRELEACCKWLAWESPTTAEWVNSLRAARRPKPPSLKEQALEKLMNLEQGTNPPGFNDYNTIRRALEALPND